MPVLQQTTPATLALGKNKAAERNHEELGHRIQVTIAAIASIALLTAIGIYGASYWLLPLDQRPFSDKHELLRPGGSIGLKLGVLGTVLFFIIFLYAFRKIIPWLGRFGTATHWMDFHVVAGLTAPVLIAYHASFKFQGIAGFAFWIMVAVALSGVIGRYLYAHIPRSLNATELSLSELHESECAIAEALVNQSIYTTEQLKRVMHVPSAEHIRKIGPLLALANMIALDIGLPIQMSGLRRAHSGFWGNLRSVGGLISTGNPEVEEAVRLVRQKVSLSRRVVFLHQTQRVFHLWHVIHRPFSYAFAVLAIFHIVVATGLGFLGSVMR